MGMDWDEIREIESRILDFEDKNKQLEADNHRLNTRVEQLETAMKQVAEILDTNNPDAYIRVAADGEGIYWELIRDENKIIEAFEILEKAV